ncbi:MAG: hypothetical protein AMXMBFR59_18550 [Rhodanobacteraceae bacterium]
MSPGCAGDTDPLLPAKGGAVSTLTIFLLLLSLALGAYLLVALLRPDKF